jgi:hypothetical protein
MQAYATGQVGGGGWGGGEGSGGAAGQVDRRLAACAPAFASAHPGARASPPNPPPPPLCTPQVVDVLKRGASHESLLCTAACILGEYGRLVQVCVSGGGGGFRLGGALGGAWPHAWGCLLHGQPLARASFSSRAPPLLPPDVPADVLPPAPRPAAARDVAARDVPAAIPAPADRAARRARAAAVGVAQAAAAGAGGRRAGQGGDGRAGEVHARGRPRPAAARGGVPGERGLARVGGFWGVARTESGPARAARTPCGRALHLLLSRYSHPFTPPPRRSPRTPRLRRRRTCCRCQSGRAASRRCCGACRCATNRRRGHEWMGGCSAGGPGPEPPRPSAASGPNLSCV